MRAPALQKYFLLLLCCLRPGGFGARLETSWEVGTVIGPQPSAPIRSGHLDGRPNASYLIKSSKPKTQNNRLTEREEMAAEQRLRKISTYVCVCVRARECGYFWPYLLWGFFFSSLWTGFASYIYAVPAVPTCTAFPVLSSAAGSVCVCVCVFVFLVNKWIYLIKVLQLRRHSWYGNTWKRSHRTLCPNAHDAFCANTHNSSGLICCSFPSPLLSLSSKPMGLMAQDLSLLPLLVVRL